jgi:hypothetical protein
MVEFIQFTPDIDEHLCHIAVTVDKVSEIPTECGRDATGRIVKYLRIGELVIELVKEPS